MDQLSFWHFDYQLADYLSKYWLATVLVLNRGSNKILGKVGVCYLKGVIFFGEKAQKWGCELLYNFNDFPFGL